MTPKNSPLVIERTANGWIVRNEWPRDGVITISDIHVFQNFEYDQLGVQGDNTLFGFLKAHFAIGDTPL